MVWRRACWHRESPADFKILYLLRFSDFDHCFFYLCHRYRLCSFFIQGLGRMVFLMISSGFSKLIFIYSLKMPRMFTYIFYLLNHCLLLAHNKIYLLANCFYFSELSFFVLLLKFCFFIYLIVLQIQLIFGWESLNFYNFYSMIPIFSI